MKFFAKSSGKKAELRLYDYIGEDWSGNGITDKSVSAAMKNFSPKADLDVYINSPGGDVFAGIAIYNILRRWEGKKTVFIDGIAASIASVIALCGDEVIMSEGSTFMIHLPWGLSMGTADDMRKYAEALDKVEDSIVSIYVGRTRAEEKKVRAWVDAETWMTADEAVERGFATSKSETTAMKAEFPLLNQFKNTPERLRRVAMHSNVLIARMAMKTSQLNRGQVAVRA